MKNYTLTLNEAQVLLLEKGIRSFDIDDYIQANPEIEQQGSVSWYQDSYDELVDELIDLKQEILYDDNFVD